MSIKEELKYTYISVWYDFDDENLKDNLFFYVAPNISISTRIRVNIDTQCKIKDVHHSTDKNGESCDDELELSNVDKLDIIDHLYNIKKNNRKLLMCSLGEEEMVYALIDKMKLAAYFSEDNNG